MSGHRILKHRPRASRSDARPESVFRKRRPPQYFIVQHVTNSLVCRELKVTVY